MQKLNNDAVISNALLDHYIDNNVGYSEICKSCRLHAAKKISNFENGPVPFFHVGENFKNQKIRPLFLGIVAYGWEGELGSIFFNASKEIRLKNKSNVIYAIEDRIDDLFFSKRKYHNNEKRMIFFSYLKDAVELVFGDNAYSKIALTNLLKCNNNDVRSSGYPQKCFDYCIRNKFTGNLMRDVEIINPTHVILMSKNHNRFYRYIRLIEEKRIKSLTIAHPSSNKSGTKKQWSDTIREFLS